MWFVDYSCTGKSILERGLCVHSDIGGFCMYACIADIINVKSAGCMLYYSKYEASVGMEVLSIILSTLGPTEVASGSVTR